MSVSRVPIRLVIEGIGEAEGELVRIRSPRTVDAIVRGLPIEGRAALWRDPELMTAINWRDRNKPNALWAGRYDPSFDRAINFLEESKKQKELEIAEKEREQKAKIKRTRIFAAVISIAAVIAIVFGIFAVTQRNAAEKARMTDAEMIRACWDMPELAEYIASVCNAPETRAEVEAVLAEKCTA